MNSGGVIPFLTAAAVIITLLWGTGAYRTLKANYVARLKQQFAKEVAAVGAQSVDVRDSMGEEEMQLAEKIAHKIELLAAQIERRLPNTHGSEPLLYPYHAPENDIFGFALAFPLVMLGGLVIIGPQDLPWPFDLVIFLISLMPIWEFALRDHMLQRDFSREVKAQSDLAERRSQNVNQAALALISEAAENQEQQRTRYRLRADTCKS